MYSNKKATGITCCFFVGLLVYSCPLPAFASHGISAFVPLNQHAFFQAKMFVVFLPPI